MVLVANHRSLATSPERERAIVQDNHRVEGTADDSASPESASTSVSSFSHLKLSSLLLYTRSHSKSFDNIPVQVTNLPSILSLCNLQQLGAVLQSTVVVMTPRVTQLVVNAPPHKVPS